MNKPMTKQLPRLIIEATHYNDHQWLIDVFDGEAVSERIVTQQELMEHVGCDSSGYVTDDLEIFDGYTVTRTVSFDDYLKDCDLYDLLAEILNNREGRTGRPVYRPKPLPDAAAFLPTEGLRYAAYLLTYGNDAEQWEAARKELSQLVKRQNA